MSKEHGSRPVVVASFLNPNEAHIFKGLLESEGIESFVYHERSTVYTPIVLGGIRVAVRAKDLDKAEVLLKQISDVPDENGS